MKKYAAKNPFKSDNYVDQPQTDGKMRYAKRYNNTQPTDAGKPLSIPSWDKPFSKKLTF